MSDSTPQPSVPTTTEIANKLKVQLQAKLGEFTRGQDMIIAAKTIKELEEVEISLLVDAAFLAAKEAEDSEKNIKAHLTSIAMQWISENSAQALSDIVILAKAETDKDVVATAADRKAVGVISADVAQKQQDINTKHGEVNTNAQAVAQAKQDVDQAILNVAQNLLQQNSASLVQAVVTQATSEVNRLQQTATEASNAAKAAEAEVKKSEAQVAKLTNDTVQAASGVTITLQQVTQQAQSAAAHAKTATDKAAEATKAASDATKLVQQLQALLDAGGFARKYTHSVDQTNIPLNVWETWLADSRGGEVIRSVPTSPTDGDKIKFRDYHESAHINKIVLTGSFKGADRVELTQRGQSAEFIYSEALDLWLIEDYKL